MTLNEQQQEIASLVAAEARRQGVNPQLAVSVAFAESSLNPSAVSPKGARGVMQLMPGTAEELGVNPEDLSENIRGGVQYLKQLGNRFDNNPVKVLSAYNAGPNAKFFETGDLSDVPDETLTYVSRIAQFYDGKLPAVTQEVVQEERPEINLQAIEAAKRQFEEPLAEHSGRVLGAVTGAVAGVPVQGAKILGGAFRGQPTPPAPPSPPVGGLPGPQAGGLPGSQAAASAGPQAVRPPLGGSAVQNYAKAFGLSDIEAARALDMTKQTGGVHDLSTQRRLGLQKVEELFPNQFREDPRFGGLMTPTERPGPGPRTPTGEVGSGRPSLTRTPGALERVTKVFEKMATGYPAAARGVANVAQKVPIVSYPLAGANIGGELSSALYELKQTDPDYYKAALNAIGALGTGLSLFPATAPVGLPMATVPPLIQYFRDRPPEEDPSLGLTMP